MGAYDSAIAAAQRIIRAKGEACVWETPGVATENTAEPWKVTPGLPKKTGVSVAIFPLDRTGSEMLRLLRGTEVVTGTMYGLMAYTPGLIPAKTGNLIRKDGTRLGVVSVNTLAPNGDVILYTIELSQ